MARYTFGGSTSDFTFAVYTSGGRKYPILEPATLTFWDAETGGTRQTVTLNGTDTQTVTVGTDGLVPDFLGPEGMTSLWADAGAGRVRMTTSDPLGALSPVAESGSYLDLVNKPTIPATAADVNADTAGAAFAVQQSLNTHKNDTTNPHGVTAAQVGLGNVNNTSDANKPVSTAQANALAAKGDKWQPNTFYAAGATVQAPGGENVVCKADHTSGASYSGTGGPNWALPSVLPATFAAMAAAPTGTTATDVAAIQAAHDALPAGGGVIQLQKGAYAVDSLTFTKPVTLLGAGGGLIGDGGLAPIRALTTIVCTSATADCLTFNGIGSTVRDLAVVNEAATTPTAGTGIKITAASQALIQAVTVLGFWNNIEVSGVYWTLSNSHLYDPVNYGLYVNNQGAAYQDHADAGCHGNVISMMYRTYNAAAGIFWRNGGGARISGCKINGASQPGNSSAGKFAYGIAFNPDTTTIVDINIQGNSIANFTTAGIALLQTNTGQVKWFNITGNQINVGWGASSVGVLVTSVDDAHVNQVANGIIQGNVLTSLQGLGISVEKAIGVHIGANKFLSVTGARVRIGNGTINGAAPINITADPQNVPATETGSVIEDWRDYSSSGGDDGLVQHEYRRIFHSATVNTDQTLYSVAVRRHGAVMLKVSIEGYNWSSGRYYVIEQLRALTRTGTGAVTVTAVGTDVAVGTAAPDLTVTYDTTTVTGEVAVKCKVTNATYPNADGLAHLSLKGTVQAVRKGA